MTQLPNVSPFPPSPSTYNYPGARWWKMDFHTHTPESWDYANRERDPDKRALLKQTTPEDWLKNHMAAGLDAVVVTDHNSTGFITRLKTAYASMDTNDAGFRPLVIFPGFELSVNGGQHLLAVFDPAEDLDCVSGVISACGYRGDRGSPESGVTEKSFADCVKTIKEHGGLAIAAHIDEPSGLLWMDATFNGRTYRNLRNRDGLSHDDAIERLIETGDAPGKIREYSPTVGPTLDQLLAAGLDALEVRDWEKLPEEHIQRHPVLARLARVTGSDSHRPEDIGRNGFSMVHMTTPNLDGLRVAFADGSAIKSKAGVSITESWSVRPVAKDDTRDWNAWPKQALENITLDKLKTAGRNAPLKIPFHPRLNVLVGGRGSGKSTIVHALRLASHRGHELPRYDGAEPVRESPAGDFWRWARIPTGRSEDGVILKDAKDTSDIKVLYRSPAQAAELHWTAANLGQGATSSPPTVCVGELGTTPTKDGGAYSASRFPLSIYSQKQVLEMSRDSAGLMAIIDREQNVAAFEDQLKQHIATYSATKAKIREHRATLVNETQDQAKLKDIVAEQEKIQSEAVKEYQRRHAQARALLPNLQPESPLFLLGQELKRQAEQIGMPDLPGSLIPTDDSDAVDAHKLYQQAQQELDAIAVRIRDQAAAIEVVLKTLDGNLRQSNWFQAYVDAKAAYDAVLGTQTTTIDPARLAKLNQDRALLEERLSRYQGTKAEIARLETTASDHLAAVQGARKAISDARQSFVETHNAKATLLRLTLIPMGAEITQVERSLRSALGVEGDRFSAAIGASQGARPDSLLGGLQSATNRPADVAKLRQRILAMIDSSENQQGFADLQNNLRSQLKNTPSRRDSIETWSPEDHLKLEYRAGESESWKAITQGSIGQQTAAVLSFLLSFGDEPLVLDQPEDDLDTRMIMSLIVDQVRRMKEQRQIIIVTHNPNIVVHGDADLVHAMEDGGGQVHRDESASGGLEEKQTRKFVCDVMEGGAIAFRRRFDRMGREET